MNQGYSNDSVIRVERYVNNSGTRIRGFFGFRTIVSMTTIGDSAARPWSFVRYGKTE